MKSYYIYIIGFILCMASCSSHSSDWETLNDVNTYIEEKADSALTVLQSITPDHLQGKEERAKHALLLSMAFPFPEGEDFPVLNKEYSLVHNPDFDMTEITAGRITKDYIHSSGNQNGIMFIQKHYEMSNELFNPLHPLSGSIVFTEYNPKNSKYKGTWHMRSMGKDGGEEFEITGEFNSCIYRNLY